MAQTERKEGYYWVEVIPGEKVMGRWMQGTWHVMGYSSCFLESDFCKIHETRIPSPDEVPEKVFDLHAQLGKTVRIYDSNKQEWWFEALTSRGVVSYFMRVPEYAKIEEKRAGTHPFPKDILNAIPDA